jgi:hypothetical protein
MPTKRFAVFTLKVVAAHVTTYVLAGTAFYPLLTEKYYVGSNPIFATFMRTPADSALWPHAARGSPGATDEGLLKDLMQQPHRNVLGCLLRQP